MANPGDVVAESAVLKGSAPAPAETAFAWRSVSGWTLRINRKLLETDATRVDRALVLLEGMLEEIVRVVPEAAVRELRKVPLYFSPSYPEKRPGAEYHSSAGWLREHGRDPAMAQGVEFTNVGIFDAEIRRMPNFALHELAHAYHDRVLGFGEADIVRCYKKAEAGGSYERVERQDSEGRKSVGRAYALSNPKEYFAECSEAFFARNDFFPYNREELRGHDPEMFEVLQKVWGVAAKAE